MDIEGYKADAVVDEKVSFDQFFQTFLQICLTQISLLVLHEQIWESCLAFLQLEVHTLHD